MYQMSTKQTNTEETNRNHSSNRNTNKTMGNYNIRFNCTITTIKQI